MNNVNLAHIDGLALNRRRAGLCLYISILFKNHVSNQALQNKKKGKTSCAKDRIWQVSKQQERNQCGEMSQKIRICMVKPL